MATILYAEDDLDQLLMVRILLEKFKLSVVEAKNGHEAITKIKETIPDLILTDLFMPYVDGFGVIKAAKADPLTEHIPIIVLSAWPTGDNQSRAKQAGAAEFVAKPYNPVQFIETINKYLVPTESS